MSLKPLVLLLSAVLLNTGASATSVSTAFNYQGRLSSGATAANGLYDLQFTLLDGATNGTVVAGPLLVPGVGVSNGLFQVNLDLGGVFDGNARWLEVAARTNGAPAFTTLTPRQLLTAAPYATYAPNAGTASGVITGAITSAMLADGAVTSSKLGTAAVKPANLDDGGSATYDQLMAAGQGLSATAPLPLSTLSLVLTNGAAPTLTFRLDSATFGKVMGFSGHEGISELYEYVVEVSAPHPDLEPASQLGHQGVVYFARNGRTTSFAGVITGCSMASDNGGPTLYTFRLGPPLAYLGLSSNYRLYQNKSVPDIVTDVYGQSASDTPSLVLSGSYALRPLALQFAEKDLSFFNRLLENEGVFYYFRQGEALPTLVLGDAVPAYGAPTYEGLRYTGNFPTNPLPGEECLRAFYKGARESTRTATLNGYDFSAPSRSLLSKLSNPEGRGELYEYDAVVSSKADGDRLVRFRAERQTVERSTSNGAGNAADLRAGYLVSIDDRTDSGLAGSYVVTSVRHGAFRRVVNGVGSLYYGNQFEVIPAATPYRPARQTPRPVVPACTAVVTGPAGQEVSTDKYGRVKVQFRWDRNGTNDYNSSGWVRVATPWAGANWGTLFVPRVGQEVLVEFVNGDPDQPVITGSYYNAEHMPPYYLPTEATKSGLRTRSTPGGLSGNELRFDDKAGAEEVYLKAAKDFNTEVDNDMTLAVGHDQDYQVSHDLALAVGNNLTLAATNNLVISAAHGLAINTANDPLYALKVGGAVQATAFQGSGSGLTSLSAGSLTGTISDGRLSANVALLAGSQTFTGAKTFTSASTLLGPVGIGLAAGGDMLSISGTARLNNNDLYLRDGSDLNHGLGWFGAGKLFANVNLDGPALYGCDGGGLGTACGGQNLALRWRSNGNVAIDPNSQNTGSLLPGLTFGSDSGEGIASKRTAGGSGFGLDFYTLSQVRMSITQSGNVGIGRTNPAVALEVAGAIRNTGALRSGTETGTAYPPNYPAGSDGLVIRRARNTGQTAGSIVARTDKLTLERDGTIAGLRLGYLASPGKQVIHCLGLTTNGTQVVYRNTLNNPATAGTLSLFSDAQKIVHYDISFGDTYSTASGHMTHVVLDRYDDGATSDNYLVGTITSTYNQ